MSSSSNGAGVVKPGRRLTILIILLLALVVSLVAGSFTSDRSRLLPEFALDLEGGTQIVLTPTATDGSEVTQSDVDQAIEIIRQRVDASGVAEAEITSQGGSNIVVGLPGSPSKETLDLVRTSAVLRMRAVLQIADPGVLTRTAYDAAKGDTGTDESADPEASPSAQPEFTADELEDAAFELADADGNGELSTTPVSEPTDASDLAWVTEQIVYDSLTTDCREPRSAGGEDDPAQPIVACEPSTGQKYILGPAELEGTQVTQASSGFDQQNNRWVVNMEFTSEGGGIFADVTGRLAGLESPRNQFAIVLDGQVVSAPSNERAIADGGAQIFGGSLNAETTKVLANQLNFGSLPLHFEVQSEEQISATLGSESLVSGLIAGLIGMLLVVAYLLWQYHGLGLVAAGSVLLATGVSYLLVCLLSWTMGYRLSMAGVVGLIISIGVTADSFIVFFERIRDEIREGRTLKSAVSHGWQRAKRTIIVADTVNLACAVVLYFLAVGSVRGFAFTLGLTTVIDLIIVMMFTYPLMIVLTRTKFFGEGRRFSGMDAAALGRAPAYRGAGRFSDGAKQERKERPKEAVSVPAATLEGPDAGLSLAQRKARDRRLAREASASPSADSPSATEEENL
ncbi:protein translocase subunit SecD [Actinomycetaceae bacterium L2_0104]